MKLSTKLLLISCIVTWLLPLNAGIAWPLFMVTNSTKWYALCVIVCSNILITKIITRFNWQKTLLATITVNALSFFIGGLALSLIYFLLTTIIPYYFILGITGFVASIIYALIEVKTLQAVFHVPGIKRTFYWLLLVNLCSTAIIVALLMTQPIVLI